MSADVLVPLGAGAVVVVIVAFVVLTRAWRPRSGADPASGDRKPAGTPAPSVEGVADGDATRRPDPDPEPVQRVTVAHAVAAREAEGAAVADDPPAEPPDPIAAGSGQADPAAAADPEPLAAPGARPSDEPTSSRSVADDRSREARPGARPHSQDAAPGRAVAEAVAQAFAAREAAARRAEEVSGPGSGARDAGEPAGPPSPASGTSASRVQTGADSDARDRLLAVLLDDAERTVGAAVDLEAHRGQLDRLTAAVRHERAVLGTVLRRLAQDGLRPEQLARLAQLPMEEVHELLAPAVRSPR